jgi:predicted RNA-binding Zn-ribbon protein involved in translation (DUF1610 family)
MPNQRIRKDALEVLIGQMGKGIDEWKAWCMECGAKGKSIKRMKNRAGYTFFQCEQCGSYDIWDD